MRDTVLQKFLRRLAETKFLIHLLHVGLRFNGDRIGVQPFLRRINGRGNDPAAKTAAALHSKHTADGHFGKGRTARQHARIGLYAVPITQPDVIGYLVRVVYLLIVAFLLHNKNRHAQLIDLKQFLRAELGKVLDE